MNCRFCGALNAREDQRCFRCGRRLQLARAYPAPETYPLRDSTAPLFAPENNPATEPAPLEYMSAAVGSAVPIVSAALPEVMEASAAPEVAAPAMPAPVARARAVPYQPSLFQEIGNVIPFRAPEAPKPRRKRSTAGTVKNKQQPPAESMSFDFALPAPPGETGWLEERGIAASALAGQGAAALRAPESEIYCDARVAPMGARVLAAAMDMGLVTLAYAVFASIYYLLVQTQTGESAPLEWTARVMVPYVLLFAAVAALYKGLYAFANVDSPGTRWANLKIVNFDGEAPSRAERVARMTWSGLSVTAVGMGLLWSLVDEEHLTWHDLLSKTFPSERQ
jgi:uncharacterized RDD family membrane protein YckC